MHVIYESFSGSVRGAGAAAGRDRACRARPVRLAVTASMPTTTRP